MSQALWTPLRYQPLETPRLVRFELSECADGESWSAQDSLRGRAVERFGGSVISNHRLLISGRKQRAERVAGIQEVRTATELFPTVQSRALYI